MSGLDSAPARCPACAGTLDVIDRASMAFRGICARCSCSPESAQTAPLSAEDIAWERSTRKFEDAFQEV